MNLENLGWQPEVCSPAVAGMPNSGRAIEAIRVRLNGAPAGCRVRYQTLTRGTGVWSDYAFDNAPSGSGAVDALRVELTEDCVP